MKKFLKKLESEFDECDGWIRVDAANWLSDKLHISLSIKFNDLFETEQWEIACSGVIKEQICLEYADTICVSPSSPLLKPYLEPEVELYFSNNKLAPALFLGIVFNSCVEVMGHAVFLADFLNQKATTSGIVSSGYGQLGCFPESLATHILKSLKGQPIQINALAGKTPKLWNGEEHVPYPKIQALQIGNSYIIAESFSVRCTATDG